MAHFARVQDGIVVDRHVLANAENVNDQGVEDEHIGATFLANLWGGNPSEYVQMSYNDSTFRGGFAGIGYGWDGHKFTPPFPISQVP